MLQLAAIMLISLLYYTDFGWSPVSQLTLSGEFSLIISRAIPLPSLPFPHTLLEASSRRSVLARASSRNAACHLVNDSTVTRVPKEEEKVFFYTFFVFNLIS